MAEAQGLAGKDRREKAEKNILFQSVSQKFQC